jgi:hypothetical protein
MGCRRIGGGRHAAKKHRDPHRQADKPEAGGHHRHRHGNEGERYDHDLAAMRLQCFRIEAATEQEGDHGQGRRSIELVGFVEVMRQPIKHGRADNSAQQDQQGNAGYVNDASDLVEQKPCKKKNADRDEYFGIGHRFPPLGVRKSCDRE